MGLWFFLRDKSYTTAELAGRLPHTDRIVARIDVDALRRSGFLERLAGQAGVEEADYRQFVSQTGFDYRKDLDAVLAAYTTGETHFFLTGRFDWKKLQQYAGSCREGVCVMDSSTAGRRISFARVNSNTLALASSADGDAVRRLLGAADPVVNLPADPVWLLIPPPVLRAKQSLPAGTHTFATAVEDADRATLGIGPKDKNFEARLEARFSSDQAATSSMRQVQAATTLLNKMLSRDKLTPNPRNLTGVLSAGQFKAEGAILRGTWPIDAAFFESLGAP